MFLLFSRVLRKIRSFAASKAAAVSGLLRRDTAADALRSKALASLNAYSRSAAGNLRPATARILIDGTWDNANYWTRYAIVRRALGLHQAVEVGLLGKHSRDKAKSAFSVFGIKEIVDFRKSSTPDSHIGRAEEFLRNVRSPEDLLRLALPHDFPPQLLFDGILKRQRRATVDLADRKLPEYLAEAMAGVEAADDIVTSGKYDLVILSHALDYTCGAFAWAAVRHGIPAIALYGDLGHAKFFRLKRPADIFMYPERPTMVELTNLPEDKAEALRALGAGQLDARVSGKTNDVGAIYAYQRRHSQISRERLAEGFGWDASKPTIGVYNSNWFDHPHASGLQDFRDFLDWIEVTLEAARQRTDVNWLFKAHPCDDWYGKINGLRLEDLVAAANQPHIRLVDKSWNSLDLMHSLDGIVTCHGTIGIEATSRSIPVLVPYPGWYGHAGFVTCSTSRQDYLDRLKTDWWKKHDLAGNKEKAELFAGWAYCVPDWHEGYTFLDDSRQDEIYAGLGDFLHANAVVLGLETEEIRVWYADGHPYFHIFKMTRAQSFRLGNTT